MQVQGLGKPTWGPGFTRPGPLLCSALGMGACVVKKHMELMSGDTGGGGSGDGKPSQEEQGSSTRPGATREQGLRASRGSGSLGHAALGVSGHSACRLAGLFSLTLWSLESVT